MPQPVQLALATFQEITWSTKGDVQPVNGGKNVRVQFNPQTLKLTYSNQKAGGDQPEGPLHIICWARSYQAGPGALV